MNLLRRVLVCSTPVRQWGGVGALELPKQAPPSPKEIIRALGNPKAGTARHRPFIMGLIRSGPQWGSTALAGSANALLLLVPVFCFCIAYPTQCGEPQWITGESTQSLPPTLFLRRGGMHTPEKRKADE